MSAASAKLEFAPSCYFVAVPSTIGATEEEIEEFMRRGPVPTDRQQAIFFNLSMAANQLMAATPQGRC